MAWSTALSATRSPPLLRKFVVDSFRAILIRSYCCTSCCVERCLLIVVVWWCGTLWFLHVTCLCCSLRNLQIDEFFVTFLLSLKLVVVYVLLPVVVYIYTECSDCFQNTFFLCRL